MDQPARHDDDLIQAARDGDQAAFSQLMQRHWTWLCRLMRAFVHDEALAEDLAQETFWRVYRHLDDYTAQGKFIPWLKRIAINNAKNYVRDHRREIALSPESEPTGSPTAVYLDPQTVLASSLLRQDVRAALYTLAEDRRQVLVLHYFGGMSIEAIAATLQIPPGTVKSRLFYGRRHLYQALLDLWHSPGEPHQKGAIPYAR